VLVTLGVAAVLHGAHRRGALPGRREVARAAVLWIGVPDLALSSSSRWLRHPSQVEPAAPFSDLPAALDVDPAGAVVGPPRAVLSASARDLRREAAP